MKRRRVGGVRVHGDAIVYHKFFGCWKIVEKSSSCLQIFVHNFGLKRNPLQGGDPDLGAILEF